MKPDLQATFQRWRDANPPASRPLVPDGYRPCHHPNCIVWIEEGQERELCYGHGGKPNRTVRQQRPGEVWRQHLADMRKQGVRRGRPCRT